MPVSEDWTTMQINSLLTVLGDWQRNSKPGELPIGNGSEESPLAGELLSLLAEKKVCEAENRLFDAAEDGDVSAFSAALAFYAAINKLDNNELHQCDFSREEILSGVRDLCAVFHINLEVRFEDPTST